MWLLLVLRLLLLLLLLRLLLFLKIWVLSRRLLLVSLIDHIPEMKSCPLKMELVQSRL
jgi:hypothetical protein